MNGGRNANGNATELNGIGTAAPYTVLRTGQLPPRGLVLLAAESSGRRRRGGYRRQRDPPRLLESRQITPKGAPDLEKESRRGGFDSERRRQRQLDPRGVQRDAVERGDRSAVGDEARCAAVGAIAQERQ